MGRYLDLVRNTVNERRVEMEKRNLDDLWVAYGPLSRQLKEERGLNGNAHVRYQNGRYPCLVYVTRRAKPSEGFEVGNFPLDDKTLRWAALQQRRENVIQAYVALVEKFQGEIVRYDTVLNVLRYLQDVEPSTRPDGSFYFWVDDNFDSIGGGGGRESVATVTKLPW